MGTKILIYDNQQAYFELLKVTFLHDYQFILLNKNKLEYAGNEVDMIIFFVYDKLELIDFVKIYREDLPVILALYGADEPDNLTNEGNIHYLNLNKLKNEIIEDVSQLINMLAEKI